MKNRIAAVMLVLMAASLGSTVLAESGERSSHFSEKMAERLGLDETQRQTLQNIQLAAEPEKTALRERMKANRDAMKALDPNDPNRSALLNDIAVEKGQLATEATLLSDRVRNEVSAVLTEEQRAKVEKHLGRNRNDGKRNGGKGKRDRRS